MESLRLQDFVRFFGCIFGLCLIQGSLFKIDNHDVTQFMVIAAAFTVLCAIRESQP